ncbi:MAG: hypothetical protein BMS9Abin28_1340 [Anaerolineae bacterium]|nr:MAG: hypothetical protein BMS9Abin28_1340 [Anaerolineae bacterium]
MATDSFDISRASIMGPDGFQRFRVPERGKPLKTAGLSPSTELIVVERNGERRALVTREMAYHHLAQGHLGGEPFMVSF